MFAQRIAVISSATAAGYGDFCNQLADNSLHLIFHTELFASTMQGEHVEQSVIAALNIINDRADDFDVVVIIRGGGGTSDFSGFDTLALAENVANFPLPIITGIGHDRDECILDMVSNTRVKTPTAAAAFLVDNLAATYDAVADAEKRIASSVSHSLDVEHMRLDRIIKQIPLLFSAVRTKEEMHLQRANISICSAVTSTIKARGMELATLERELSSITAHTMEARHSRLKQLELQLRALDPARMLKYGYSITRINGKAVYDAATLTAGDTIETTLRTGTIKSTVK